MSVTAAADLASAGEAQTTGKVPASLASAGPGGEDPTQRALSPQVPPPRKDPLVGVESRLHLGSAQDKAVVGPRTRVQPRAPTRYLQGGSQALLFVPKNLFKVMQLAGREPESASTPVCPTAHTHQADGTTSKSPSLLPAWLPV